MPFLELPDGGVLWNGCALHLQPGIPHWEWRAHLGCVVVLFTLYRGGPHLTFGHFLLLGLLLGDHIPLIGNLLLLPFIL